VTEVISGGTMSHFSTTSTHSILVCREVGEPIMERFIAWNQKTPRDLVLFLHEYSS